MLGQRVKVVSPGHTVKTAKKVKAPVAKPPFGDEELPTIKMSRRRRVAADAVHQLADDISEASPAKSTKKLSHLPNQEESHP